MRREQGSVMSVSPDAELVPFKPFYQPGNAAMRFRQALGFGPVALATVHVRAAAMACREIEAVLRAGYQGAFLAPDRLKLSEFAAAVRHISSRHRGAWIGLKLDEMPAIEELDLLIDEARNLWICDMDSHDGYEWLGGEIERIRCTEDWDGLLFGSLPPTEEGDLAAAAVGLSRFVDVVVWTVSAGQANLLRRTHDLKHALGNFPLALSLNYPRVKLDGLARAADCLICPARLGPVAARACGR